MLSTVLAWVLSLLGLKGVSFASIAALLVVVNTLLGLLQNAVDAVESYLNKPESGPINSLIAEALSWVSKLLGVFGGPS
jgi:hypothetical protein